MNRLTAPSRLLALLITLLVSLMAFAVVAQDQPTTVSDDQVNTIAKKLYCPVCENITLDTCGTAACADWRDEIRLQLEAGRSEDQIIADFVSRFGDRVVGTPQDGLLRALSLVTPWVIIAGVLLFLGRMVLGRRRTQRSSAEFPNTADNHRSDQKYQDLLEQDLEG
ncbi:MAG: cytochrome c-type biogenesis protein CcmH [Chloroflexota bacterium]